jgi:hypothetical protein
MGQFFIHKILRNKKGQSAVEYILLLAVISGIGFAAFHNPRFKNFLSGRDGVFAMMRAGMAYSYHYGRENKNTDPLPTVNYSDGKTHDTYYNRTDSASRFFMGNSKYPP